VVLYYFCTEYNYIYSVCVSRKLDIEIVRKDSTRRNREAFARWLPIEWHWRFQKSGASQISLQCGTVEKLCDCVMAIATLHASFKACFAFKLSIDDQKCVLLSALKFIGTE